MQISTIAKLIKKLSLNTKRKELYFLPLFPLFIMVGSNKKMVVFLAIFYENIVVKIGYIKGVNIM